MRVHKRLLLAVGDGRGDVAATVHANGAARLGRELPPSAAAPCVGVTSNKSW